MNCPIAMKILIINLKAPRIWNLLDGCPGELYQTFEDKLTPTLYNLSQKIENEQRLPKSFYEARVTLKPKLDRNSTINKSANEYLS